jgi:hypothetical protein
MGSRLPLLRDREVTALTDAGRRDGWEGIADHLAKPLQAIEDLRDDMRDLNQACSKMMKQNCDAWTKEAIKAIASRKTKEDGKQTEETSPPVSSNPNDKGGLEDLVLISNEMKVLASAINGTHRISESFVLNERPCERAYRPDVMERDLKIHAEIDKRIEKCMTRLVRLKEYKRMYAPKEVKGQSAAVITLPAKQPGK